MSDLPEERIEYIRRLIAEIREQINSDPELIEDRKHYGDEVMSAKWLNINLLCLTIEHEVLGDPYPEDIRL